MKTPETTIGILSARIGLKEAIDDITAMLTKDPLKHFSALNFGGSIPKVDFFPPSVTDTNDGVKMWYCHNNNILRMRPILFLACERMLVTEINNDLPKSQKLIGPTSIYMYNGNRTTALVRSHLKTERPVEVPGPVINQALDKAEVVELGENFMKMQIDPATGNPFNEKRWAYFQNNIHGSDSDGVLTKLVNQENVEHIHYYFGYNEEPIGKNRIRLILIGADEDHKLLTNGVIVQRSVPPLP